MKEEISDIEIETLLERIYLLQTGKNGDAQKTKLRTPEEYEAIWEEIFPPDDS